MVPDWKRRILEMELENGNASYCRKGLWDLDWVSVLNNDGNIFIYRTHTASFRIVSNSGQEGSLHKHRIITGNDNKVLWIGRIDNHKDNKYFISCGEKVYKLNYRHKELKLFPSISSEDDYFDENDEEKNDGLIIKYRKNMRYYCYTSIEDAKKTFEEDKMGVIISLDKHFEKGFFYKGFKWDMNWQKYYGYSYVTIFIDILVKNGLFCIEIENITYPFYGYVLLDLNEIKILEAKKGVYGAEPEAERQKGNDCGQ